MLNAWCQDWAVWVGAWGVITARIVPVALLHEKYIFHVHAQMRGAGMMLGQGGCILLSRAPRCARRCWNCP